MPHDNQHSHSHGHNHVIKPGSSLGLAFSIGIIINLIFVVVEFGAGLILDSVALMSDAGHNLSDVISLALALFAFRLARTKPNDKYTYGRKKSTVTVSLINALLLLAAIGIIVYESIEKISNPQPVQGGAIAIVAGIGIVINGFTAWLFLRHKNKDINVKGAYLHMVADTLVSVGVLASGLVISFTGYYLLDPIIGLVVAAIIMVSTWSLLRDSIRLSMDGVPRDIDPVQIRGVMERSDSRILGIHHLHIWPLSTTENALTAHIVIDSMQGAEAVKQHIRRALSDTGISHSTLEFELPGEQEQNDCGSCDCR